MSIYSILTYCLNYIFDVVHSKNYSAKNKSIGVKFSTIKDFLTGQHQKCYFSSS